MFFFERNWNFKCFCRPRKRSSFIRFLSIGFNNFRTKIDVSQDYYFNQILRFWTREAIVKSNFSNSLSDKIQITAVVRVDFTFEEISTNLSDIFKNIILITINQKLMDATKLENFRLKKYIQSKWWKILVLGLALHNSELEIKNILFSTRGSDVKEIINFELIFISSHYLLNKRKIQKKIMKNKACFTFSF